MSSQSRGIRFPNSLWEKIAIEAARQNMQPADFVRAACNEKLTGGDLEARLAYRLEALPTAVAQATADEIEGRRRAALAAKQAREASQNE